MSRGKKLTATDKARAVKLYELGHSWRAVATIMHLNHQVLSRVCGKMVVRSRHDVMVLAWKNSSRLGPRHLRPEEIPLYKKLRYDALRMEPDDAVRTIVAMREVSAASSRSSHTGNRWRTGERSLLPTLSTEPTIALQSGAK